MQQSECSSCGGGDRMSSFRSSSTLRYSIGRLSIANPRVATFARAITLNKSLESSQQKEWLHSKMRIPFFFWIRSGGPIGRKSKRTSSRLCLNTSINDDSSSWIGISWSERNSCSFSKDAWWASVLACCKCPTWWFSSLTRRVTNSMRNSRSAARTGRKWVYCLKCSRSTSYSALWI